MIVITVGSQTFADHHSSQTSVRNSVRDADRTILKGNSVDLNHPLRRRMKPEALLRAAKGIEILGVESLDRTTRKALSKWAKRPARDLKKPEVQRALIKTLSDAISYADKKTVARDLAGSAISAAQEWMYFVPDNLGREHLGYALPAQDLRDMKRTWGWSLLPKDDPAFKDADYGLTLLTHAGQTAVASGDKDLSVEETLDRFQVAWSKLAPRTKVIALAQTGSDANNLLFDVAKKHSDGRREARETMARNGVSVLETVKLDTTRKDLTPDERFYISILKVRLGPGKKLPKIVEVKRQVWAERPFTERSRNNNKDVTILVFSKAYVAGRGKLSGAGMMRHAGWSEAMRDSIIESPTTELWDPSDAKELARLKPLEERALQQIRDKVETGEVPVGGIFIEPIIGAGGVLFYRPEFMRKLRALADELDLPIFVDEILTGGGRTGRFFAYEHYDGFTPDYVTFGKGLQISGIAEVSRQNEHHYAHAFLETPLITRVADPMQLAKATQVLTRIDQGNLIKNAEIVGDYFLKRLRKASKVPPEQTESTIRGKGLMIHANYVVGVNGSFSRLTPYLTLTKEQVDQLVPLEVRKSKRTNTRKR